MISQCLSSHQECQLHVLRGCGQGEMSVLPGRIGTQRQGPVCGALAEGRQAGVCSRENILVTL